MSLFRRNDASKPYRVKKGHVDTFGWLRRSDRDKWVGPIKMRAWEMPCGALIYFEIGTQPIINVVVPLVRS